jgi:hypothetical protein
MSTKLPAIDMAQLTTVCGGDAWSDMGNSLKKTGKDWYHRAGNALKAAKHGDVIGYVNNSAGAAFDLESASAKAVSAGLGLKI